jgi:hypothetical protein
MGWGSLISSIGNVVGGLINELSSESVGAAKAVTFHLTKSGEAGEDGSLVDAKFVFDDGGVPGDKKQFRIFNASVDSNDVINMTFPAIGDSGPETLHVPGRYTYAINDEFARYGNKGDCSKFILEAGNISSSPLASSGYAGGLKISCIGYNVPVDGKTEKIIGSRVSVIVSPESITVKNISKISKISSIDLITIIGASDSRITITDQGGQSGTDITIALPHELKCGFVDVSLTADFADGKAIVEEFAEKHKDDGKLRMLSPAEHAALLKKDETK